MTTEQKVIPSCVNCTHYMGLEPILSEPKCANTQDLVSGEPGRELCKVERRGQRISSCGYTGQFFTGKTRELKTA